jgi:multiple sugar transport system permease protein
MKYNSYTREKNITFFLYLTIPVILTALLVIYPLLRLVLYSFTDWNGFSISSNFIGFDNYKKVFMKMPEVWLSLRNNAIYLFGHLFFIPVEILIAYYLDRQRRLGGFFKTMVLLPFIMNGVAVSYMFSFFFSPSNGAMDAIMAFLNQNSEQIKWLSNPDIVNFTLTAVSIWRFAGFHIVLFLAGIISIPKELFEAAQIDGAGEGLIFRKIVIPNIITIIEIVLFLNVRGALQVFDIPFVMTGGGPGYASSTFTLLTIKTAFNFSSFGLASSLAVVLFVLIILFSTIQNKFFQGGTR